MSIRPDAFQVIVGPNNSGKSNLVESLAFLGDIYRHGLELAIAKGGGVENIAFRDAGGLTPVIGVSVVFEASSTNILRHAPHAVGRRRLTQKGAPDIRIQHEFEIDIAFSDSEETAYSLRHESIEILGGINEGKGFRLLRLDRTLDENKSRNVSVKLGRSRRISEYYEEIIYPYNQANFRQYIKRLGSETALLTEFSIFSPAIRVLVESMAETHLYQLSPLECRRAGVPTPNAELGRHGENLPGLVDYLRHDERAWREVIERLRRISPTIEDVGTSFTPDRRRALSFKEFGRDDHWNANDVSDGTIQSLALFCVLADTRDSIVMIEEPENSVHPWIVRVFLDACRAAPNKQIFVTTHSPAVLSQTQPSDVLVAWRVEGATHIERLLDLEPEAARMVDAGELDVYELLDSGWVEQSVPGGLQ